MKKFLTLYPLLLSPPGELFSRASFLMRKRPDHCCKMIFRKWSDGIKTFLFPTKKIAEEESRVYEYLHVHEWKIKKCFNNLLRLSCFPRDFHYVSVGWLFPHHFFHVPNTRSPGHNEPA